LSLFRGSKRLSDRDDCAQADEVQAFAELFKAYRLRVFRFIRKRWIDAGTADDLTQEVFFRAWKSRGHFRGHSQAETYLIGIALNVLREHWRRTSKATRLMEAEALGAYFKESRTAGSRLAETEEAEKISARLEQALITLSAVQRDAFEKVHIEQLSAAEAAKLSGCTVAQIYNRAYRARKKLRRLLGPLCQAVNSL